MQTSIIKKPNTIAAAAAVNFDDFSNLIKQRTGYDLSPSLLERIVKVELNKSDDFSNRSKVFNDNTSSSSSSENTNNYSPKIEIDSKSQTIAEMKVFKYFVAAMMLCFLELLVIGILIIM